MAGSYILISKRERWGLTWKGWLSLILLLVVSGYLFFSNLYDTLAPVERVEAKVLVLEGAVTDQVLTEAIREFRSQPYEWLITTGTPLDYGSYLIDYGNTAAVMGMSLLRLGFDSARLIVAGSAVGLHDRTYHSALALKNYLRNNMPAIKAVNVMSPGVHAGRSRLLFRAALGDSISVGIIAVPSPYYQSDAWWQSSKGFRDVLSEMLGYYYVRFFFRPYEITTNNAE